MTLTDDDLRKISNLIQDKNEDLKEEFAEKLTEFKSDILNKVDAVFKEVKASREEQTIHTGQHQRGDKKFSSYEDRLTRVEQKLGLATQ